MAAIDLTGKRFGRLLVMGRGANTEQGRSTWDCACDCGSTKNIKAENLTRTRGAARSCGCIQRETRKSNGVLAGQRRDHPFSRARMYREHKAWENMIARCTHVDHISYPAYGAKGVTVCSDWLASFEAFATAMGPCPDGYTLERNDYTRGYELGNCCWASRKTQANNKSSNRHITAFGRTQTAAQWADETGLGYAYIYYRVISKHLDPEVVLARHK